VVDDDADCRETVAAVLEPEGYDVVLLQNGDEALEYVRNIGLINTQLCLRHPGYCLESTAAQKSYLKNLARLACGAGRLT